MDITIKDKLTVTYSVDKCANESLNGTHTEDFSLLDLTADDIEQYLAQTLIIKRQAILRGKGNIEDPVKIGTWKVPAPGKRVSVSVVSKAETILRKLTPEQRKAILEALEAGE